MTLVEGDDYQRLWLLVGELSQQLTTNREVAAQLQARVDELKGQALHNSTGYALRRFNLDISKEKFESNLEKLNASLVVENQTLAHENKQLNLLLREYEQTLETIMGRFRSFSHATQSHTLQLTSHYESLLAQAEEDQSGRELSETTAVSARLSEMGSLVRLAMRSLDGEVPDSPSPSSPASVSNGVASGSQTSTLQRESRAYGSAPSADPKWHGSGGYTGTAGDPAAARSAKVLEDATEEERLRYENAQLRELLKIATEMPDPPAEPPTSAQLSLGQPRKGRRSSSANAPAGPSSPTATATAAYTIGSPGAGDSGPRSPLRPRAAPLSPTGRAPGPTLIPAGGAGGPPQLDGPPPPLSSMSTSPVRAIPAALAARAGSPSPSKGITRPLFEDDEVDPPTRQMPDVFEDDKPLESPEITIEEATAEAHAAAEAVAPGAQVDELGAASTEMAEELEGASASGQAQHEDEQDRLDAVAPAQAIPDELEVPDLPSQNKGSAASAGSSDEEGASDDSQSGSDASRETADTAATDSPAAHTALELPTPSGEGKRPKVDEDKSMLGLKMEAQSDIDEGESDRPVDPGWV